MLFAETLESRTFLSAAPQTASIAAADLNSTNPSPDKIRGVIYQPDGGVLPGDANGDGRVDLLDFNILVGNFGLGPGLGVGDGDFTGDGFVNILDFNVLAANFGSAASPGESPATGLGNSGESGVVSEFADQQISFLSGARVTQDPIIVATQ